MSIRFGARKSKGPGPLTVALLVLSVGIIASNLFKIRPFLLTEQKSPLARLSAKVLPQGKKSKNEPVNAALIDAIVAIVQTYYVDGSRVDNQNLIGGAMRSMAYAIPDLKYEESETELTLYVRDEALSLPRSQDTSYDDLMAQLKTLAGFCAKTGVGSMLTPASMSVLGSENNASTIVLNAMLSALDAHSALMSPESYKELRQGTEGSFGGLGVLVGVKDHLLTVLKPMPRSPALRAGIRKNDRIVSIDGFPTFGLSLDQLVSHMRGEPGSQAQLSILRPDAPAPWIVSVPREVIEVDSVDVYPHHEGDLHYLHLVVDSFASRTGKEIYDAIRQFRKNSPLHGVVLDLRSNPGGLLDQAITVSDIFLKSGVIVSTKGRHDEVERATTSYDEVDFPVVVLMNEDSASASEIVAGALQDNGRAIVVGQPSFGKGSVQTLFELPEDRALKLTIARYYTPANRSIQNVGITPDVWVQPVISMAENMNLFGPFRYRNEAFLPNHLTTAIQQEANLAANAMLKGYYLFAGRKDVDAANERANDIEFRIAKSIIGKAHALYGNSLPEGARRASHMLALASQDIRGILDGKTTETHKWLKDKMKVDWRTAGIGNQKNALSIQMPDQELVARSGSKVQIPWKIKNSGETTVQNVSIFFQSPMIGLETQEFLAGPIAGGATVSGVSEVFFSQFIPIGHQRVAAGVAVDAVAVQGVTDDFKIELNEGRFADLEVSSEFVDGPDSREKNALDENEHGILRVRVKNKGNISATKVTVSLANLAGKQLKLVKSAWDLVTVNAGTEAIVDIPVQGGAKISFPSLTIGAVVSSKDLKDSVAKLFEFKGGGLNTASKNINAVSH